MKLFEQNVYIADYGATAGRSETGQFREDE